MTPELIQSADEVLERRKKAPAVSKIGPFRYGKLFLTCVILARFHVFSDLLLGKCLYENSASQCAYKIPVLKILWGSFRHCGGPL